MSSKFIIIYNISYMHLQQLQFHFDLTFHINDNSESVLQKAEAVNTFLLDLLYRDNFLIVVLLHGACHLNCVHGYC